VQVESPGAVGITTERGGATAGVFDTGGKTIAIISLFLVIAALVVAMVALVRADAGQELAEARYADLVARNATAVEVARVAERDATVAVERSHDLMARVGRLEAKAGIYSTDH
jgi:hypothetical protein